MTFLSDTAVPVLGHPLKHSPGAGPLGSCALRVGLVLVCERAFGLASGVHAAPGDPASVEDRVVDSLLDVPAAALLDDLPSLSARPCSVWVFWGLAQDLAGELITWAQEAEWGEQGAGVLDPLRQVRASGGCGATGEGASGSQELVAQLGSDALIVGDGRSLAVEDVRRITLVPALDRAGRRGESVYCRTKSAIRAKSCTVVASTTNSARADASRNADSTTGPGFLEGHVAGRPIRR